MISPTEMLHAQINLGETLFKREWDENTAPMLSVFVENAPACQ